MTMPEIKNLIEQNADEYEFFGIRMDDREFRVGDSVPVSHQLYQDDPEDGTPYNEELGMWDAGELHGTCSIGVNDDENDIENALELSKGFSYYDHMYLIAGKYAEGGNDEKELIIEDAKVIGGR